MPGVAMNAPLSARSDILLSIFGRTSSPQPLRRALAVRARRSNPPADKPVQQLSEVGGRRGARLQGRRTQPSKRKTHAPKGPKPSARARAPHAHCCFVRHPQPASFSIRHGVLQQQALPGIEEQVQRQRGRSPSRSHDVLRAAAWPKVRATRRPRRPIASPRARAEWAADGRRLAACAIDQPKHAAPPRPAPRARRPPRGCLCRRERVSCSAQGAAAAQRRSTAAGAAARVGRTPIFSLGRRPRAALPPPPRLASPAASAE
jgi:hypothetical protein